MPDQFPAAGDDYVRPMRCWQVHELGDPIDRLVLDEVEVPEAGTGRVVLDVEAVGLAFPNVLQCRGEYQVKPPLPFSPAAEVVGRVAAVGDGVGGLEVGQRVVSLGGALADQAAVGAGTAFVVPDGVAPEKAVALPTNYCTTWYALHDRAQLQPGETLLVTGASGGTGSAAIQLGLAAGARVIAVAGGPKKVAACAALGADEVIDYSTEDIEKRVKQLTDRRGAHVVLDHVGADAWPAATAALAAGGRYGICGVTSGYRAELQMGTLFLKQQTILGVFMGRSGDLRQIVQMAGRGVIRGVIHTTYPLQDAAKAHEEMEAQSFFGKLVLTVP